MKWRQPQNEDDLKNEDNLENEDNINNEDELKNENNLKNESKGDLKNENYLKYEDDQKFSPHTLKSATWNFLWTLTLTVTGAFKYYISRDKDLICVHVACDHVFTKFLLVTPDSHMQRLVFLYESKVINDLSTADV